MKAFALKGDVCFSREDRTLAAVPGGYVVCDGGVSGGVFEKLPERYAGLPVLDFSGKLIVPGLVDLHIHAPQYAFRGLSMDLELMDWLEQVTFPEEAKYRDLGYAEKAYGIFASQLQRSATTRACVFATSHVDATRVLMEALEKTGLVTMVGKVNMDRGAPEDLLDESAGASIRGTEALLRLGGFERTTPILTPRFIPCCTDELMAGLQTLQEQYGLPVQSHLSENLGEIALVRELCPDAAFYGAAYDRFGLFGRARGGGPVPTVMAHCVHSTPEERALMRENGVFIAHCPASNTNLSSGAAPVRRFLEEGIDVGLGSDVAGGHTESIFRALTDAVQVSKLYFRLVDETARPLTFEEAFFLATRGGGRFFGQVGSFGAGFEFDALVLDDAQLPHPQELTPRERLERFAYLSGDLTGVAAKFVRGRRIEL